MSERIEVRADWPAFAGHFEGRPILPGIAHLALVRDALRRAGEPAAEIVALSQVRFRQVVEPGDVLELVVDRREGGGVFFELFRGGRVASRGGMVVGDLSSLPPESGFRGQGTGVGAQGSGLRAEEAFPAAEMLVPHRGPALLLERVLGMSADELRARILIPADSAFVSGGEAAGFVALEAAAQAAAAHEALRRQGKNGPGEPHVGYLVGARDVELRGSLRVGAAVEVAIRVDGVAPPLSTYRFEVAIAGDTLASGSISTYLG